MKTNWISCLLIVVMICMFATGCKKEEKEMTEETNPTYEDMMEQWQNDVSQTKLSCWYTDKADKKWLETMAGLFEEEYKIKVDLVYYDGMTFFEDINSANQKGEGPDVYLCENDQLELVRNSGLAQPNTSFHKTFWEENYPKTAYDAVTFKDNQYGYPVYFDTYCLVYDSDIVTNVPASMEDILVFADEYSDTGSTKAILRWDVADPYINTMFLASYADIFGENGDDELSFQIYNEDTVQTMEYFNSISEYMWMDKSNISHDIVKERIKEGTLVLGLCKSDILPILEELDETGYRTSYMPSITEEYSSKPYSTTYIAMVNPYCKDETLANMFSCYLSLSHPELQYEGNGKLPVVNQKDSFSVNQAVIYAQYLNSTPVPKVMLFGDYISESAITYDAIWEGKDADKQLSKLQEIMDEKIETLQR